MASNAVESGPLSIVLPIVKELFPSLIPSHSEGAVTFLDLSKWTLSTQPDVLVRGSVAPLTSGGMALPSTDSVRGTCGSAAFDGRLATSDAIKLCIDGDLTVVSGSIFYPGQGAADQPFEASAGKPLVLKDRHAQRRLSQAIAQLQTSPTCGSVFVQLDDCERDRSRYLVVSRQRHRAGCACVAQERQRYLVTIRDLSASVEASAEALENSLGLTPMEARLCIAIMNEQSLQEFADVSGVAISTVRWHWGNVRQKLNVRTQLGLVRMLMRLALP